MTTKAVIYARVSSKEQEREGFSIPAQLELLRDYAKKHGLEVVKEFKEAETAKSSGRQQFSQMLALCKQKAGPSIILVEKTDRLYRNFKDYVSIEELMISHEAMIHLVKEGEVLSAKSHSNLKFIHGIRTLMAKNYIDNLSEEVKKGQRQKVLDGGWPCGAPYGYRIVSKQLEPNPETAHFVKRAFELYGSNLYSLDATRKQLFEEGILYRPYLPKIGRSALHAMLQNRLYIGEIVFKGEVFPGKHPPLVSLKVWNDVQESFRKDNKPIGFHKQDFVYRGLLFCGECGRALVGEIKKQKFVYYRCAAKKQGCSQGYVKESLIEETFTDGIDRLVFPQDFKDKILTAYKEMEDVVSNTANEELERLNKEEQKLLKNRRVAYQDKMDGKIPDDLWDSVASDLQLQLDQIKSARDSVSQADASHFETAQLYVELPEMLAKGWLLANHEEKKVLANLLTSNCFVKDGKATIELKEAFKLYLKMGKNKKTRGQVDVLRTFLARHSESIQNLYRALVA